MQELFKKSILRYLQGDDHAPVKASRLARDLGVAPEDLPAFQEAFDDLRRLGHLSIPQPAHPAAIIPVLAVAGGSSNTAV
jgi:hypothetical protein